MSKVASQIKKTALKIHPELSSLFITYEPDVDFVIAQLSSSSCYPLELDIYAFEKLVNNPLDCGEIDSILQNITQYIFKSVNVENTPYLKNEILNSLNLPLVKSYYKAILPLARLISIWGLKRFNLNLGDEQEFFELTIIIGCLGYRMLDNLNDSPEFRNKHMAVMTISTIFLIEFFNRCHSYFDDVNHKDYDILVYHNYLCDSTIKEHSCFQQSIEWKEKDIFELGRKLAPMKIIFAFILKKANHWHLKDKYEAILDNLQIGIQLQDDLADWKEDLKSGYISFPVNLVIRNKNLSLKDEDVIRNIEYGLYVDGLIFYILDMIENFLKNASKLCEEVDDSLLKFFILTRLTTYSKNRAYIEDSIIQFYRNSKGA